MIEKLLNKLRVVACAFSLASCIEVDLYEKINDGIEAIITPKEPTDGDDLLCYLEGASDQSIFSYIWHVNGNIIDVSKNHVNYNGSYYFSSLTEPGDVIGCEIIDDIINDDTYYDTVVIRKYRKDFFD